MTNEKLHWNENLAYAVGLFVADGHLSKDGRHLAFVSKDYEQILNFKKSLNLNNSIRKKKSGYCDSKKYYQIQFGDVKLYKFLLSIGIPQRKTYEIGQIDIPNSYFPDYLRGFLDGDGSITYIKHPETSRLQVRTRFSIHRREHADWLKDVIRKSIYIQGGYLSKARKVWQLIYCKRDSLNILKSIYYPGVKIFLSRKAEIAKKIIEENIYFKPEKWKNRFT